MYWGQPWTAPWGAPDNTVRALTVQPLIAGGAVLELAPAAGFGDSYHELFVGDRRAAHFFVPEVGQVRVPVLPPPAAALGTEPVGFALYGVGGWSFPPYSLQAVHLAATAADRGRRARLTWSAVPMLDGVHGDSGGQLSAWTLTGFDRNRNIARVADRLTRGRLFFRLVDTAGTRLLTLFTDESGQAPVAQGSRTGDGVIVLAPLSGSGISGAATVAYASDIVDGWIDLRWPASYEIFANGGSGAIDFGSPFAVVQDNGRDTAFVWSSAELAAGSWDFCLRAVSDTGIRAANTAVQVSLTVALPPEAPGLPVYLSGDAASGLTFQFAASATAGATYRLYRSLAPDQTPDTGVIDATAAAGASQISSSPLTGGAGRYSFLLVAVNAAGESLNAVTGTVVLSAAGAVIAPLPPEPTLVDWRIAGRDLTALARFRDDDAPGAVVVAVDFYLAAEADTIDWASPTVSAAPVAMSQGWRQAAGTLPTAPADGWYQLAARTRTAAGDRDTNSTVRWLHLSSAAPATVTPTATLIR